MCGVGTERCVRSATGDDLRQSRQRAVSASRPGSSRRSGEAAAGVAVLLCPGSGYPPTEVTTPRRRSEIPDIPLCAPSGRYPGEAPEVSGPVRGAGSPEARREPGLLSGQWILICDPPRAVFWQSILICDPPPGCSSLHNSGAKAWVSLQPPSPSPNPSGQVLCRFCCSSQGLKDQGTRGVC